MPGGLSGRGANFRKMWCDDREDMVKRRAALGADFGKTKIFSPQGLTNAGVRRIYIMGGGWSGGVRVRLFRPFR